MLSERIKGHLCVFTTNAMFGIFIPISKHLLKDCTTPMFMTFCRFLGAAILFWGASFFVREKVERKDLCWLFFFALTGVILNQGLFMFALSMTSPIDASVILTATPFAALGVSYIFLKDPITRRKVLGISVGAAGAIWLLTSNTGGTAALGSGSIGGDMLVLFTTFCAAVYFVFAKPLTLKYSAITIMKWMFLFSLIMFLPLVPASIESQAAIEKSLSFWEISGMIYVVAGATFFTYLLQNMGIKRIRPTTVAMYIYIQPVISSIIAIFMSLDVFSWDKLFASLMVFVGVYIVTSSPRTKAQMEFAKEVEEQAEVGK